MSNKMDYKKKYKEALKRAKHYKEGITDRKLEEGENIMDHIFPELKELEDERIRKNIIATINLYYGEPLEDEAKEMIAWLEKQGEQKSAWGEEDEIFLYKIQDHIREFYVDKKGYPYVAEPDSPEMKEFNWLKSLKDRIQQPK